MRADRLIALVPVLPSIFGNGIRRHIAERGQHGAGGDVIVSLTFESEEAACGQILGLGPLAEVLSPPELRQRLTRPAAAISAVYDRDVPRP